MEKDGQNGLKNPHLIKALEELRPQLNSHFHLAQKNYRELKGDLFLKSFKRFLEVFFDQKPLTPEDQKAITPLYKHLLTLYGKGLFLPTLQNLWEEIFPLLKRLVVTDPHRFPAALTHFTLFLQKNKIDPKDFKNSCTFLEKNCTSPSEFLFYLPVLAWVSGFPPLRLDALKRLQVASLKIIQHFFHSHPVPLWTKGNWQNYLTQLEKSPWALPEKNSPMGALKTQQIGGFEGDSGLFKNPPRLIYIQKKPFYYDGDSPYSLNGDLFGTFLHKEENGDPSERQPPPEFLISCLSLMDKKSGSFLLPGGSEFLIPSPQLVDSILPFGPCLAVGYTYSFFIHLIFPSEKE